MPPEGLTGLQTEGLGIHLTLPDREDLLQIHGSKTC